MFLRSVLPGPQGQGYSKASPVNGANPFRKIHLASFTRLETSSPVLEGRATVISN